MKRIISLFLFLAITISLLVPSSVAALIPSVNVSSANGNRGDTVTINVSISSENNMAACGFTISYDSNVLELISAQKGSALATSPIINTNRLGKIVFSYASISGNVSSGAILNLKFKIKDDASYGKSDILIELTEMANNNFESLNASTNNGYVTVNAPKLDAPSYIDILDSTDNSLTLIWEGFDGATGYNIYLNNTLYNSIPLSDNVGEIVGLRPDSEYVIQVTTINYSTESDKSSSVIAKTSTKICQVLLVDWDFHPLNSDNSGSILWGGNVTLGDSVPVIVTPERLGYRFIGWDHSLDNITEDIIIQAQYERLTYTVTFVDHDGTVLKTQTVNYGEAAVPPDVAIRDGYTFTGWDLSFENVTADITVKAMYSDQLCAHEKTSLKNAVPSTCTEHGYGGDVVCDSCGKTIASGDELELLPHFYTDKIIAPQPGIRGYTLHTCTECGHSYKDNYTEYIDPNTPKAVVETKTAAPGDTVTVNISLENAPAVKALTIRDIVYDSEKLELINGKWNINGATIADWNQTDKNAVLAFGHNTDVSGVIFTLTFKVAEGIENANVSVGCKVVAKEKTDNGEETEVSVSVISGAVIISNVKRGDVNGDGYIDSDDAIYMLRYIMMPVEYPINQNGDFNGDGRVNSDDAIYLLYHVLIPDRYELK